MRTGKMAEPPTTLARSFVGWRPMSFRSLVGRPIAELEPPELLDMLRKVEKRVSMKRRDG